MEDDDGVQIDVVEDKHPTVLQNENPAFMVELFNNAAWFLQIYGWVFLIAGGIAYWLWVNVYKPKLDIINREKEEEEDLKKTDNNSFVEREARMLAARERMQAKYDAELEVFREKQAKLEEKRREERISDFDKGFTTKLANKTSDDDKSDKSVPHDSVKKTKPAKPLRPADFNPLMGAGGSGYRPAARGRFGGSGGGG